MTDQTPSGEADKKISSGLEELRFAKTQQWRIATSAITLLAAIFAVAHATTGGLKPAEKIAGTLFVALIALSSSWFLCSLQRHLKRKRLEIDPEDKTAWLRGLDILVALITAIILTGVVVGYFLWRGSTGLEIVMTHASALSIAASALSIAGLVMNLFGVILLFLFGMPFHIRTGGRIVRIIQQTDPKVVGTEGRYGVLNWLGLALIVLGTAAQIGAILLS
jgi:hypothetical protein